MPDTLLEGVVNKFILCLILSLASPSVASDLMSPTHFFPIVSRTDGLAGTRWSTSVQIYNPHAFPIIIAAHLSAAGSVQTEVFEVGPGETRGWSDFLGEVFDAEGNGALFLEAEAAANHDLPPPQQPFAASMRISTDQAGGGSFGQGVPSLDPVTGFLGDWTATFPSVALWGQPGEEGFRTNVGFWNIGADDARLRLRILDSEGAQIWQQLVTVHRHDPMVMALPRDLDCETATLVVDSLGGWVDCAAFISIVDNITGDAAFFTSQLMDPEGSASGGDPARSADRTVKLMDLVFGESR